ncbi:MAG: C25 family cysteine peptidase [Acidobacteriota bacterium]
MRSKQGLITALVDIEDIYDEFSFGNKSPQSVKDFLSYAAKSWKVKPRFVLLAADASYDARNYLGLGDNDLVPTKLIDTTYLETASDDWFVDFNDDGVADLTVGRLPVRTAGEAYAVVSKLIAYEQSAPSKEVALVADSNDGFDFELASTSLRSLMPASIRATEIFRSRSDDSTARTQLLAAINRGQKIVNYTGHGSVNVWRGNLLDGVRRPTPDEQRSPVLVRDDDLLERLLPGRDE